MNSDIKFLNVGTTADAVADADHAKDAMESEV